MYSIYCCCRIYICTLRKHLSNYIWSPHWKFPGLQDKAFCAFSTLIYCSQLNGKWSINSDSARYFVFMIIFHAKSLGDNTAAEKISLFNINRFLSQCQFSQISQKGWKKDCEAGRQTQHSQQQQDTKNKYISQFPLTISPPLPLFLKGLI